MTLPIWRPDAAFGDRGGWVWATPDFNALAPTPTPPGTEVEIVLRWGDWALVRAAAGWQGWTSSSYLIALPLAPPGESGPAQQPVVEQAYEPGAKPLRGDAVDVGSASQVTAASGGEEHQAPTAWQGRHAPHQPAISTHAMPTSLPVVPLVGAIVIAGALIGGSVWALAHNGPSPTSGPPLPPGPSDGADATTHDFELNLEYTRILGDFDSCRWGRTFAGRDEADLATQADGSAFGTIRLVGAVGEARVVETNLLSGQLSECPAQALFDVDQTAQIVSDSRETWSAVFTLDQGLTATMRGTRHGDRFDLELVVRGAAGPNNVARFDCGVVAAPVAEIPTEPAPTGGSGGQTSAPDVQQLTLFGEIENASGQFRAGACTWAVTLTGTVEANVEIVAGRVSGEAHVLAHASTRRLSGSPSCSGDDQDWDQVVDVSGTTDDVRFVVGADPFAAEFHGLYDELSQSVGGAIAVNSTIPEIDGTVTGDLNMDLQ